MESSEGKRAGAPSGWLLDVNVWLALCSDRHEHHHAAAHWLADVPDSVYFCRVTQMSLLRLLTNPKVMGEDLLSPEEAINVYRELLADERVHYAGEPANVENLWLSMMTGPVAKGSVWTDAWLAAFAMAHGSRLVSFDSGMRRWDLLHPQILTRFP